MAKKPLLIFPSPTSVSKTKKYGGAGNFHFPSTERQVARLDSSINSIERVLVNKTAYLGQNPANFVSEMIIVLEVAGILDDFFKAVKLTPGMEFLMEYQTEFTADDDFHHESEDGLEIDKPVGARLFLTMTNQQALRQLLSYWNEYKKPKNLQSFERGTTKFRTLFEQLKDIRPYSVEDRLRDTGFSDYIREMEEFGVDNAYFEIELAYKSAAIGNDLAFQELRLLLEASDGEAILASRVVIPEIQYHAFIAKAPIGCFRILSENTNVTFLKSQKVLYFRPVGQSIYKRPAVEEIQQSDLLLEPQEILQQPVVALLDGLPIQNHHLLDGYIIIDDPEDFSNNYTTDKRFHGTTMASLIINGDLSAPNIERLARPIYVRPIMKPDANGLDDGEFLPDDKLPLDLIHRAVVRMFEGEAGLPPVAPNIKIINLSIGDSYRPFHNNMSTWAKLIDWLSFKYNVLFIVSAGNKADHLLLDIDSNGFDLATPQEIEKLVLKNIISGNADRKILTPAESLNSIAVGSSHHDLSVLGNFPSRKNMIASRHLVTTTSRIGFGYNQSIKPDLLMPGGRKLFRKSVLQQQAGKTLLTIEDSIIGHPPGNKVAIPGGQGDLNGVGYTCGTSNSTALTTRLAAQLYEMLLELNSELEPERKISSKYFTVILKSLLAHGANWGEAQNILVDLIRNVPGIARTTVKKHLFPYLGYGCIDAEKILYCTDQRVTLIGFGELSCSDNENAHLFTFPLPPSIGQQRIDKRLVITLGYLSPLNFNTSKYRKAQLYFDNLDKTKSGHLELSRNSYDFDIAQKGTLQHDILTGNRADAFVDGDSITIQVNCRQDASGLDKNQKIPYGLTVTMEILENIETEIYEEVELRLRQRIRPRL
jgi:hypothetical protein